MPPKPTELAEPEIRQAVERLHDCTATFRESVHVKETFKGRVVWDGVAHVFDIEGHPKATSCYAWGEPVSGSDRMRFNAVLHIPPVDSPLKAVQAYVVQTTK